MDDKVLRDHFAGLAMQALLPGETEYSSVAQRAYFVADAMILARKSPLKYVGTSQDRTSIRTMKSIAKNVRKP